MYLCQTPLTGVNTDMPTLAMNYAKDKKRTLKSLFKTAFKDGLSI